MSLTRAFLEVIDGPGKGRRIVLREGQMRYVGRTGEADDSFPDNKTMSAVHFSARWFGSHCEIKDLNSANKTWLHEKPIVEALLHSGEEVRAGKAIFRFVLHGREGEPSGNGDTAHTTHVPRGPVGHETVPEIPVAEIEKTVSHDPVLANGLAIATAGGLRKSKISEGIDAALVVDMPLPQFVEHLASRDLFIDSIKVVAHALTRRSAVYWAARCVRAAHGDQLSPADEACLVAADAWVQNPAEEQRRQAQAAAEAADHKTPASWVAMAAFWSSGSLAPPTAPVVPPGEQLTAHAASGAVMLAAVARQPEKANEKYRQFLQFAAEIMNPPPK
jgi:hypothetical protein